MISQEQRKYSNNERLLMYHWVVLGKLVAVLSSWWSFDWSDHHMQWTRLDDVRSYDTPSLCEDSCQSASRSLCIVGHRARCILVLAHTWCRVNARCVYSMHSPSHKRIIVRTKKQTEMV